MKTALKLIVLCLGLLALAACEADDDAVETDEAADTDEAVDEDEAEAPGETTSWQLGHLAAEDHSWHLTAEHFAELVNEGTNGELEIEIFPNEQLGGETSVLDAIQGGTADMTLSGETMENWAPEAALMATPYAMHSEEHLTAVAEGEIGDEIEQAVMDEVGVTPLYYHVRAPRNLTSTEPIHTVEDLAGFRMRVPNVPVFMDAWEAAGASPQVMDFGEVFSALQQGVIDGQENPVDLIHSASFYEVQDYVNTTEHVYSWIYMVVGNDQWAALDDGAQEVVLDAAAEAQEFGEELYAEETEQYREWLQDEGMTFNDDVDREGLADAMRPAIEESLSETQLDLYERIIEAGE